MEKEFQIIHVFDDDKFIDSAIALFESVFPKKSKYFVIVNNDKGSLKYVKSNLVTSIKLDSVTDYNRLSNYIDSYDKKIVFLHALNYRKQLLVSKLSDSVFKVWFVWGYDLYNQWKPFERKIYERATLDFLNKDLNYKSSILNKIYYSFFIYKLFKNSKRDYNTIFFKSVQNIDIAVPVIPTEMKYINALNKKIKYAPFTYGYLEYYLGDKFNMSLIKTNNILVGNSANPTNNHIEIFNKLSMLTLGDRKVIVPLNYGNNGEYLNFVLKKGRQLLGENFYPITKFLSLNEYNDLTLNCGYLIFNHIRQQGVANLIVLGSTGTKIFLNQKSSVYKYYQVLGMNIHTIKQLNNASINELLSEDKVLHNKQVFIKEYSLKNVQEKIIKLMSKVLNQSFNKLDKSI
jgi:dTDP-N-acetylfucosamine:lipid II N-acetylfucosaminyltransferase